MKFKKANEIERQLFTSEFQTRFPELFDESMIESHYFPIFAGEIFGDYILNIEQSNNVYQDKNIKKYIKESDENKIRLCAFLEKLEAYHDKLPYSTIKENVNRYIHIIKGVILSKQEYLRYKAKENRKLLSVINKIKKRK